MPSDGIIPAGLYRVIPAISLKQPANYTVDYANGVYGPLTVNKAEPTISLAGGTFIYDGLEKVATGFTYGVNGIEDFITPALTFSYAGNNETIYGPTASAPIAAGTYHATAHFEGNDNYNASEITGAIIINKKEASVTPTSVNQNIR
ncbi:MAG: hypothetical protein IPJ20_06445 [Flammeovirgaceae bacterium]|nr:hypothetical protein [Flammeovirgaceae bacterium]